MERRHFGLALLAITSLSPAGFGGDLRVNFLPELGSINSFDLRPLTLPLALDWYPFSGGFHLTGGLIFNQTKTDLDAASSASPAIGGTPYSAADPGAVHGKSTFHRLTPYAGIGWSHAFGKDGRCGIVGNLGLAFLGRPHVALTAPGPIGSNPGFQSNVAREEEDIEDDLRTLRSQPIIWIGLFYRF